MISEKWRTLPLSEVCIINPKIGGEAPPPDTEISFVPMAAVAERQGGIVQAETRLFRDVAKGYTFFREDDVLFAKITPCMENGKIAIARGLVNGIGFGSTEFHVIRCRPDVLPEWVFAFVSQPAFRAAAKESFTGTAGQQRVPADFVKNAAIPLPPLAEQERLVRLLDEADTLRRLRARADARMSDFIPALFHEMFGDPARNEKGWATRKVAEMCELVRGSSPRPKSDPKYYGGPVPRLMIEDITRDGWHVTPRVDSLTEAGAKLSRPVPAGTVVMAVSGNVGLMAKLAVDACIHDGFVAFKNLATNLVEPDYFVFCLTYLRVESMKMMAGAIFQNLTTNQVKGMTLPLPPYSLQREFAARVSEARALEEQQAHSKARLEALFESMLARAFAGEL